ncbi:hypothetical protein F4859DRAFT_472425 [Xylaria cf. heliscus]|nr:hypothetical protein F4859DRAFT_472425 [Xylaria cf. heliscus]
MDRFPRQEQPAGDASDFSDDEGFHPRVPSRQSRHDGAFSTIGSSDMAHIVGIDRNEYSDEDIKIVYEIVVRAETILAEELTPSSRLPTHALFLAYDEILAEYGLDPSERHISKLVFMVGGVKGQKSLMEKFQAVMARMNITLAIEEPQASGSERDYRHHVGSDAEDLRVIGDEYTATTHAGEAETNGYRSGFGYAPDAPTESLDAAQERHLADKAVAFRKRHHAQFLAVAILRRWHNTAYYVNYLSAQSDATREAVLIEALEDHFHMWRAVAVETEQAAPNNTHPNAYSKRTERIAIRTHEILLTKKALIKWRQSLQDEYRKSRDAKLLADRLARQAYDDDDFKENPQLARLAQRAHRNLVLSRAFSSWSNRVEEEGAKAEVAATAYEMNLKAKALGFARNRSVIDDMRKLLASKVGNSVNPTGGQVISPDTRQPELPAPALSKAAPAVSIPFRPPPPSRPPLSSIAIVTQLQARKSPVPQSTCSAERPSTVIPISTIPSAPAPPEGASPEAHTSPTPPEKPVIISKPTEDANTSDDDQLDERTMLARRHILRMRYFGAWETYTSENIAKVEEFEEEKQNQRVMWSISTWREQAASRPQQAADCEIEFEETRSYRRAVETVPKWRGRASREAHRRGKVLEHYAERADYYSKTTKALPVLRGKTEQANQREKLLGLYAERTNYYLRTTQALSIWRERAQEASQTHHLHECYGERANYYYRTRTTLSTWRQRTKQRRKEKLREAHLETRRKVKRGMGERCINQWRNKLEPSYERYEIMNVALGEALEDREWRQASQAVTTWRRRAQARANAAVTGDTMLKQKAMDQWQDKTALHRDLEVEAEEHWELKAKSRTLKNWNLSSLQNANRPEMVANALEKKERKLLRQRFETWYSRTADKLVPVQLPDGTYRNVGQVVENARQQAVEQRARGFLDSWRTATVAAEADSRAGQVQNEAYAPTPGRPRLLLGSFATRQNWTTTPLAPVPSYAGWQGRDSRMGRSEFGTRVGRSERAKNPKNLRVSWAADGGVTRLG